MASAIRIALVGVGKIARDQHVPALRGDERFDLVATADQRGGVVGVPAFPDLDTLIAKGPMIDAVAVCTPPQARAAVARAAIEAGKHVLLEKPPAATLGELASLARHADRAGVTLFAAWHSRFAAKLAEARAWLGGRTVVRGSITWREDVRRWHPGQTWLWAPGGLGVFDPGINALSILTELLGGDIDVAAARLEVPANAHTAIAATLALRAGGAPIAVDFDFRQQGPQTWELELVTDDDASLRLSEGGAALTVAGGGTRRAENREYPALHARFAELIAAGRIDADAAPLRLVADALLIAEVQRVAAFVE